MTEKSVELAVCPPDPVAVNCSNEKYITLVPNEDKTKCEKCMNKICISIGAGAIGGCIGGTIGMFVGILGGTCHATCLHSAIVALVPAVKYGVRKIKLEDITMRLPVTDCCLGCCTSWCDWCGSSLCCCCYRDWNFDNHTNQIYNDPKGYFVVGEETLKKLGTTVAELRIKTYEKLGTTEFCCGGCCGDPIPYSQYSPCCNNDKAVPFCCQCCGLSATPACAIGIGTGGGAAVGCAIGCIIGMCVSFCQDDKPANRQYNDYFITRT